MTHTPTPATPPAEMSAEDLQAHWDAQYKEPNDDNYEAALIWAKERRIGERITDVMATMGFSPVKPETEENRQ